MVGVMVTRMHLQEIFAYNYTPVQKMLMNTDCHLINNWIKDFRDNYFDCSDILSDIQSYNFTLHYNLMTGMMDSDDIRCSVLESRHFQYWRNV